MSTLTKILIVLVSFSVFWLCASVVTYVANADNYKQLYEKEKITKQSANAKRKSAEEQLKERKDKYEQQEDKLNNEIALLKVEIDRLKNNFRDVERKKADLQQKVESWVSITENLSETTDRQRQLFENTFDELIKVKAERDKKEKEISDLSATLEEKMAIIQALQIDKKRLVEEKTDLQSKLDQFYRQMGKTIVLPKPVTPEKDKAKPAEVTTRNIDLKGLVTAVDLKNSMASISIGYANGVKEGMKFYVTRGDKFICEILIINVGAEEAVGFLERVQHQPKIGDKVSTNL